MLNDPSGGYPASYPADLRAGAGYRIDKSGLSARIVADYTGVPLLTIAPAAGHVLVQDPATKGFTRLDLNDLPTTVPQDGSASNVKLAAMPGFTIKGNAVGATAQPQDIPLSDLASPGNPIGDALAAAARRGHTSVSDANYQILVTDVQVGVIALTAPRVLSLPDVDSFPLGQDLVIADESGACSDALTITIQPRAGTGDVLGVSGGILQLFDAYQSARFRRGAANLWIRL